MDAIKGDAKAAEILSSHIRRGLYHGRLVAGRSPEPLKCIVIIIVLLFLRQQERDCVDYLLLMAMTSNTPSEMPIPNDGRRWAREEDRVASSREFPVCVPSFTYLSSFFSPYISFLLATFRRCRTGCRV